jgi:hypothetical protein
MCLKISVKLLLENKHLCNILFQIPGSTHYSLVMYFVTNSLKKGSLLQRFFDGDDEFRNSRLKLIPAVPKVCFVKNKVMYDAPISCTLQLHFDSTTKTKNLQGSWIVRQSVGSTPCLLGKAVDCSYVRGPGYLEVSHVLFFYLCSRHKDSQ